MQNPKTLNISYKLHASQFQVFSDSSRFVILAAGRRFGKTILALIELLAVAFAKTKSRCWYIAPTYKQAETIAWKLLLDMIPHEAISKKNEVKLEIILVNGSEIALKGADNEDNLVGVGLNFVVLDEMSLIKPHVWEKIIRPMLTDTLGRAIFISTPRGKNHFWELWLKGQRHEDNYSSYQFKTCDNPFIKKSEIEEAKTQLSDQYFRQEYEANFEDYTGLIWPEFNDSCLIDSVKIEDWWEKFAVIDPAISGTTAVLFFVVDGDGRLYVYEEYYEQDKRVSEVCESVKTKSSKWFIDPAAKEKNVTKDGRLYSLYDEYADYGIHPLAANNEVDAGINRVAEYFKKGKIKITKSCRNLIHELERYHWSEEKETTLGVMKPKPYKSMDHACDCLRYAVMTRFQDSVRPVPKSKDKAFPLAYELLESEAKTKYQKWME